jgi:iron complex outermembrane receptor protein
MRPLAHRHPATLKTAAEKRHHCPRVPAAQRLAVLCAACFGAAHAPVQAQDTGTAPQATQRVVITTQARKRTEAAQDVPITMEVFSGKFVEEAGISTTTELQYNVPGLTIQPLESGGLVSLRGVGSGSTGLGYDPSTAVHIDGIYVGTSSQALSRLFDLGTLEVLKGPQGTLYGRNATDGVINIVTRRPDRVFGGQAELSYGNDNHVQGEAALNLPLGQESALRLAVTGARSDGNILNLDNGHWVGVDDHSALRARLGTRLGSVTADALVQHVNDRANSPVVADPRLPLPIFYNSVDSSDEYQGYRRTKLLVDPQARKSDTTVGLTLQGEISDTVRWKSITGWLDFTGTRLADASSFGQTWIIRAIDEDTRQVSQELQLLIDSGATDWVLGAYYYRQKGREHRVADIDENFDGAVVEKSQDSYSTANGTAYALFADANHRLSPSLRLNAGVRLNRETKDASVTDKGMGYYFPPNGPIDQKVSFNDVSGRVGLDYTVSKGTLLFGGISKGFKAGGIQPFLNPGSGALETYQPEKLIAYEAGVKHALPGKAGNINASAFWYDYRDIQVRITDLSADNIRNASNARVYGIDLQGDFNIAGPWGLDVTAEWLRANYKAFVTEDRQGNPLDFSNNVLPRAPKLSYAVGLNLERMALAGLQLSGRLEYTYRDKIFFEASNATKPGEELSVAEALGLANLNLSLTRQGAPWTVQFTARNLADKQYLDQSIFGLSFPGPGRNYRLGFKLRF